MASTKPLLENGVGSCNLAGQETEESYEMVNKDPMIRVTSQQSLQSSLLGVHGSPDGNPGTTMTQTSFNLVKNIAGPGVLSLPSGVAAGTGLVPAVAITVVLGLYSGWTFSKIGEMCGKNNALTFTELGEKVHGKGFAKILVLTCTIQTFFSCLVCSLVICDSWTQILLGIGFNVVREQVLLGMAILVLLPLCLMEDLSVLAYTSLLGSAGILYTVVFMMVRLYDESYLPGGQFFSSVPIHLHPNFEGAPNLFTVDKCSTPILVSLLSTAYLAHYNAPKFYEQLVDHNPVHFSTVSFASFSICILLFGAFMIVGYKTFGINSNGFILNNYSPFDKLAIAARFALGTSMLLSYPLPFTGLRDGTAGLIGDNVMNRRVLTISLLTFITGFATIVTDVGLVNNIQGAILGSALIYCFPGMVLIFHSRKVHGLREVSQRSESTFWVAGFTVLLGVVLGSAGVSVAVEKQYFPQTLHPLAH